MKHLNEDDIRERATRVARAIDSYCAQQSLGWAALWGVPRGGVPATYAVARFLTTPYAIVDKPADATFIIDDIVDSGATRDRMLASYPYARFHALVWPGDFDEWVVFPWEGTATGSAEDIPLRLLQYVGVDPEREGLRETPRRFLQAWTDYTSGYKVDPSALLKSFADGAERYDELVLVRDIPVYSHCEHHLAPFFGTASVAYIPNGKVVGLSKLARLVDAYARRLQVQERLTQQIAHTLNDGLSPVGVGVVLQCRHMCMEARGVRTAGATTVTSCLLGAMKTDGNARAELMRLVQ